MQIVVKTNKVSWQLITGYGNQGMRKAYRSVPDTMTGTKPKGAVNTAFKLINPEATSIRVSTGSQLPAHHKTFTSDKGRWHTRTQKQTLCKRVSPTPVASKGGET